MALVRGMPRAVKLFRSAMFAGVPFPFALTLNAGIIDEQM